MVIKQAVGGRPPQYVIDPCDLDLCPSDLESGVRVTCDMGYLASLVSNYSRCMRQTDVRQKHRLMPHLGAGS